MELCCSPAPTYEKVPFVRPLLLFPTTLPNLQPASASTQQSRKERGDRSMQRAGKRAQAGSPTAVCLVSHQWRCQAWGEMYSKYLLAGWSAAHTVLLMLAVPKWHNSEPGDECAWAHHPQGIKVQCKFVFECPTACEQTQGTSGLEKRAGSEFPWQCGRCSDVCAATRPQSKENS